MSRRIIIDLDKWTTQSAAAKARRCSIQYINKLIKTGKLEALRVPEIGIVLVKKTA